MKKQIDPKIVAIIIGLIVLILIGLGWRVLGPGMRVESAPTTHPTNG